MPHWRLLSLCVAERKPHLTVLEAAGVISDIAARVEAEPHLVQLLLEHLWLPRHQILRGNGGSILAHGAPTNSSNA